MLKNLSLYFTCILLLFSCSSEFDVTEIEEEPFMSRSFVEVKSLMISTVNEVHFTCQIGGKEYVTEIPGLLILKDILLEKKYTPILIKSNGFFDELRYVMPAAGTRLMVEVYLKEKTYDSGFAAQDGGVFEVGEAKLTFAPNNFVDENGQEYLGQVNISAKDQGREMYYTTSRSHIQNNFEFEGKNATLNLVGGLDYSILDESLNPLFLKEDAVIQISIGVKIPDNANTPDVLEIIYYDEVEQTWKREVPAEKEGDLWYGNIRNIGSLIWGRIYETTMASVQLKLADGSNLPFAFVTVYTAERGFPLSFGFTDRSGIFRVPVPVHSDFNVNFISLCRESFDAKGYTAVEASNTDIVVLDDYLVDGLVSTSRNVIVRGNAVDCQAQSIVESALLISESGGFKRIFLSDNNGDFEFGHLVCRDTKLPIQIIDLKTLESSDRYDIKVKDELFVDARDLLICDPNTYFVRYFDFELEYLFSRNLRYSNLSNEPPYLTSFGASTFIGFTEYQTTIFFEFGEERKPGTYPISSMQINFDNQTYSYTYNCDGDCDGTIKVLRVEDGFLEGLINFYDPNLTKELSGTFRVWG